MEDNYRIRLEEAEQGRMALQNKLNVVRDATDKLMRWYEEAIILTERWADTVFPYTSMDSSLMSRRDNEISLINKNLKDAKRNYYAAMSGERVPDVSSDVGKRGK